MTGIGIPIRMAQIDPESYVTFHGIDDFLKVPVPTYSTRDVYPILVIGEYAIYELYPEEYHVLQHGEATGGFKTTDPQLAGLVCRAWAQGLDPPEARRVT